MLKIIGGVVVGVFIGAVAVEILNRKMPGLIRQIEDKAEEAVSSIFASFRDGYGRKEEVAENAEPAGQRSPR
jgi:hypothetical protein